MSSDGQAESFREPIHPSDAADQAHQVPNQPYRGEPNQGSGRSEGVAVHVPHVAVMAQPYKDTTAAWLMLLFLGGLGGHDFYLRDPALGITKAIIFVISAPLTFIFIGYVPLFGLFIWNLIDAIRMGGRIQGVNSRIWHQNQSVTGLPRQ